jgi:hypothetical protein
MPSRSDRKTMPCSASSRIVVITSAALRPKRSMPMTTMASPSRVPERDRTLLTLRFFENMSQIAERLGMSQMHVLPRAGPVTPSCCNGSSGRSAAEAAD